MQCVLDAFEHHMAHLGLDGPRQGEKLYIVYYGLKTALQGNVMQATDGPLVPYIARAMAEYMDLGLSIQHRVMGKDNYLFDCRSGLQRWIVENSDFGEWCTGVLTLEPAVYLLAADSHAVFAARVPQVGIPVMALQFYRKENDHD